jgi:hypothetical protein
LRALLVVAHPRDNACAKAATERIRTTLERRRIEVDMIDLYTDDFDSRLTGAKRRSYLTTPYLAKSCPEVGPALFNPLCKSQCIATQLSGCPLFCKYRPGGRIQDGKPATRAAD